MTETTAQPNGVLMGESKAQRASRTLREAADALDAIPGWRRMSMLVPKVNAQELRNEADHIDRIVETLRPGTEEAC